MSRSILIDPLGPPLGPGNLAPVQPVSAEKVALGLELYREQEVGVMNDSVWLMTGWPRSSRVTAASGCAEGAARFHRYSLNNHLMMSLQRPDAIVGRGVSEH